MNLLKSYIRYQVKSNLGIYLNRHVSAMLVHLGVDKKHMKHSPESKYSYLSKSAMYIIPRNSSQNILMKNNFQSKIFWTLVPRNSSQSILA